MNLDRRLAAMAVFDSNKNSPPAEPLTGDEKDELTKLREKDYLYSLGDRPSSMAAADIRRMIELESKPPAEPKCENVMPSIEDAKQWKRENSGYYISPELENGVAKYMSDYAMEVLARSGYFDGRDSKGE